VNFVKCLILELSSQKSNHEIHIHIQEKLHRLINSIHLGNMFSSFSVINLHFCALLSVMQELHLVRDQLFAEQERASKLEVKDMLGRI